MLAMFLNENVIDQGLLVFPDQDGSLGVVWAPTQDGGYRNIYSFLPETPADMRRQGKFAEVPIIIGLNSQDGAKIASQCSNLLLYI